jgi:SAM-dependent methyltransferase
VNMVQLREALFEMFSRRVLPGAKVLDIGSRDGVWPKRLHDTSYDVTACDIEIEAPEQGFPHRRIDLNGRFAEAFDGAKFDAISLIEAIEHLENPRQVLRQIKSLLKPDGVLLFTTPNASGVYSRVRFFFTGRMAMFNDSEYELCGHITPVTLWQVRKMCEEIGLEIVELRFYDSPFLPPRGIRDLVKILSWIVFRPLMFGGVGGQTIICVMKPATAPAA